MPIEKEPLIRARTSTKVAVGGGVAAQIYVALVHQIDNPELVAALTTPEAIAFVTTSLIAWFVARISKTPLNPSKWF